MTLLIWGLALIILILIVALCSIHNPDIAEMEIELTPNGIIIKFRKMDKPSTKRKKVNQHKVSACIHISL